MSILNFACMPNMKIAISENLPFVWQDHPPVWEALPSTATFHAEEKPEQAEKLWNVLCAWYEKHVRLFSCFLEGMNIIELPPFISQIWWQLSSGTAAERRVCERCGENWNLHGRRRDFSVHLQEKWRAVLWCLLLSDTLTDFGLGWARWGGHRKHLGVQQTLLPKKTKSFFSERLTVRDM